MEMVGTTFRTKEEILAGVFKRLSVASEGVDSDVDISSSDDFPSEDQDQMETITPTCSLHKGMYAPLVRLPLTLGHTKSPYIFYEGYRRTSASSVEPAEPLLPSGTDEEALAIELYQEEE